MKARILRAETRTLIEIPSSIKSELFRTQLLKVDPPADADPTPKKGRLKPMSSC